MQALGEYIHSLGLKAGFYSNAGVRICMTGLPNQTGSLGLIFSMPHILLLGERICSNTTTATLLQTMATRTQITSQLPHLRPAMQP